MPNKRGGLFIQFSNIKPSISQDYLITLPYVSQRRELLTTNLSLILAAEFRSKIINQSVRSKNIFGDETTLLINRMPH